MSKTRRYQDTCRLFAGGRRTLIVLTSLILFCGPLLCAEATVDCPQEQWKMISFPDFFNFDVPEPWPQWDSAVDWYLAHVKSQQPDFVLVAGDLVNGHWWEGERCVEQMGALYYSGWKRRMQKHGLKYYTAIGDHELGDDPWSEDKIKLVPHFERVFAEHMQMPDNGPEEFKGRAYYVINKNVLMITVETFEIHNGEVVPTVSGKQLDWFKKVIADNKDKVDFIVVQGHVAIFGGVRSRSSSKIYLEDGRDNDFWKAMKDGGVDVYLCGEFHDVTILESDEIWQIVHGSSWGRKRVNTMDYLVMDVSPKKMTLQMKSFPMQAGGRKMWNLHKSGGPREIVEISEETRKAGPQVTGTLVIDKSDGKKKFTSVEGVFTPEANIVIPEKK